MGAVWVVFFLAITSASVVLVAPHAAVLRNRAGDLLEEHDVIRSRLLALYATRDTLTGEFDLLAAAGTRLPSARAGVLLEGIRNRLDSVVAVGASLGLAHVPDEVRMRLAEAVQSETRAALAMADAVREMQLGRVLPARVAMDRAEQGLDETARLLSHAQRVAIGDVVERETELLLTARQISRLAVWSAAVAAVLLLIAGWLLRERLYRPIATLERAVGQVAGGDLSTEVRGLRADELGRLASHFNQMTAVLRERAAAQDRRHETLSEQFGRVVDESSNEIYLFDAATLRFTQANRGARVNLGYAVDELLALTPLDILAESHRELFLGALAILRRGEQPRVMLSAAQVRRDGTSYPVEISLQLSDRSDQPVFVAVVEDVSQRSRLRELNDRLRQFALAEQRRLGGSDLATALAAITDMAAETLRVQRTSVWIYTPEHLRCIACAARGGMGSCEGVTIPGAGQSAYLEALLAGEPIAAHDAAHDPRTRAMVGIDGPRAGTVSELDVPVRAGGRLVAVVVHEHAGEPRRWSAEEQGFAGSVADLVALAIEASERSRLETQLAKVQKLDSIGQLAGGVAHDFNNLLTAILGYAELVLDKLPEEDGLRGEIAEIHRAADRGAQLTRQLLTFARTQVIQPRVVDLNDLTRGAEKLLRRLLGEHIELTTRLDPALGMVRVDPGHLEQVLVNLAVNSRDAMPAGGRLTIETRNVWLDGEYAAGHAGTKPGQYVQLTVTDTGQGMDRETLGRLFEPFFTTKSAGKGTGLGLAICYGIVRQAGGHIWAYSEPDRGTTMKIHLPVVTTTECAVPVPEQAPAVPRGQETILLVEDEPQIREVVRRVLTQTGYRVIAAGDGREGLELAASNAAEISAVVTDVVLPHLGGAELVARLRQERPGLPVLFMSGYTQGTVLEAELQQPRTGFLSKPFTPSDLARRVRDLLDRE